MTFSPLANKQRRIPDGGRSWPRDRPVTGVGLHHNAGVDAYSEASNPGREVSANYWITNAGEIIPNVDESRRAFTSGHPDYPAGAQADMRNITIEISNSPAGVASKSWAISDAARNALVRLIADIYQRYDLGTVKRGAARGVGVHSDWVPTECPGDYIRDQLPSIIREANQINQGGLTMSDYKNLAAKIDALGDRIDAAERRIKNSSNIGWLKRRIGGGYSGESLTSKLNRVLGGIAGLEPESPLDAKELAAEIRKAFGDDLAADVAAELTITTKEND